MEAKKNYLPDLAKYTNKYTELKKSLIDYTHLELKKDRNSRLLDFEHDIYVYREDNSPSYISFIIFSINIVLSQNLVRIRYIEGFFRVNDNYSFHTFNILNRSTIAKV